MAEMAKIFTAPQIEESYLAHTYLHNVCVSVPPKNWQKMAKNYQKWLKRQKWQKCQEVAKGGKKWQKLAKSDKVAESGKKWQNT